MSNYKGLLLTLPALAVLLTICSYPVSKNEAAPSAIETLALTETAAPNVEDTSEPADSTETFVPTFEAGSCPFKVPASAEDAVECGFVAVSEDHNDPDGPTIRIAVAILKDQSDE